MAREVRNIRPGPASGRETEADRDIQRYQKSKFDHSKHVAAARIQREEVTRARITFETHRGYLGKGTARVAPYDEVVLPFDLAASRLCLRIAGIEEGESIELLPEGVTPGYRSGVQAAEKRYTFRRTQAADDFTIPAGRVIRLLLKQTRLVSL